MPDTRFAGGIVTHRPVTQGLADSAGRAVAMWESPNQTSPAEGVPQCGSTRAITEATLEHSISRDVALRSPSASLSVQSPLILGVAPDSISIRSESEGNNTWTTPLM